MHLFCITSRHCAPRVLSSLQRIFLPSLVYFLFLFYPLVLLPVHLCLTVFVQLPNIQCSQPHPISPCLSLACRITFPNCFQQSPLDSHFLCCFLLSRNNNAQSVSTEYDSGFACCSFYVGQIPHEESSCQLTAPENRLSNIIMG